jgi:phage terminase large subunit-like protein
MRAPQASYPLFLALWNRLQNQKTPHIHLRVANWLQFHWQSGHRRLVLLAFRAFGKSTLMGLFCAWLLYQNANLRILVVAADMALSEKMVRNVKRILETHPLTLHLKPMQKDQWASDRFTVERVQELRDPSMLAKGIFSNLTGTRADFIICDDVEVPKTSDTHYKREDLRHRLSELDYILAPEGSLIYIGTPHHAHTIYSENPRRESGEEQAFLTGYKFMRLPVEDRLGQSVWPERFSMQHLQALKLKNGPLSYQAQMLCQPVSLQNYYFKIEDLCFYKQDLDYSEVGRQAILRLGDQRLVSCSCWWDPSFGTESSDYSVLAVVYTDVQGRYYLHHVEILNSVCGQELDRATAQCQQVAQIVQKFYVPSVALETNGIGKFLPGLLRKELKENGISCAVRDITSRTSKSQRILEAFDAVLAARNLSVHHSVHKTPFITELQEWSPDGTGKKNAQTDDCLDAVAGALSLEPVRFQSNSSPIHKGFKNSWRGSGFIQAPHDFSTND